MPIEQKRFGLNIAAKALYLHPSSVLKLCRKGEIGFVRAGRRLLFTDSDIDEYLSTRRNLQAPRTTGKLQRTGTLQVSPEDDFKL
jgi:excisionase family DNA binding protein